MKQPKITKIHPFLDNIVVTSHCGKLTENSFMCRGNLPVVRKSLAIWPEMHVRINVH